MNKLRLIGHFAYVDKYNRNIFALDDESAAKVGRICDVDPDNFPVKSAVPLDPAGLGRAHTFLVLPRRFSLKSRLQHNRGETVSGVTFSLIHIEEI